MSETQPPETPEADKPDLRAMFIEGCVRIIQRGDRLPDSITELVAREVGLVETAEPSEDSALLET